MSSRSLERTISAVALSANHAVPTAAPGTVLPTVAAEEDESTFTTSAIDETLSRHRQKAAFFKQLPPQPKNDYRRVHVADAVPTELDRLIAGRIRRAIELREKWVYARRVPEWVQYQEPRHSDYTVFVPPPYDPFDLEWPPASGHVCQWQDGVVNIFADRKNVMRRKAEIHGATLPDYATDLAELMDIMNDPEGRTFCYRRLMLLQERFNMYLILNEGQERLAQIAVPHRDLYNVRKVDVHVHHSSMANQKHLLRFIKRKVRECGDEKVLANREDPTKEPLTLHEVFRSLDLSPHELSVDTLDVHADRSTFHRFDRFNLKYNPFGQSRLREIFMKTDNHIRGKYLAEITHEVFNELHDTKYQNSEYRISIYGRDPAEWDKLGTWFMEHKVYSDNVRWLIQIPRLYSIYKARKLINSFQDMLDNIFNPLFEATVDPCSHKDIACLLQQLVGFDSVDDESQPQVRANLGKCPVPELWNGPDNPPYSYYSFYIYSNLAVLNRLREAKGMNTFTYRPHAGEAGDIEHLATSFLLAHGINHGLNLKKSPVLQYLFYVTQIGIAMSPLSNNALFCEYTKNPLPTYFKRGLNVALSTDDPLQFAFTREPLMEEYSVAAQVWKLSSSDLCELARNSVLQSGFEPCIKARWLGQYWYKAGEEGNDISRTNVPGIRLCYRFETLLEELKVVYEGQVPDGIRTLPTFVWRGGFEGAEEDSSESRIGGDSRGGEDAEESLTKDEWEGIMRK